MLYLQYSWRLISLRFLRPLPIIMSLFLFKLLHCEVLDIHTLQTGTNFDLILSLELEKELFYQPLLKATRVTSYFWQYKLYNILISGLNHCDCRVKQVNTQLTEMWSRCANGSQDQNLIQDSSN